MKQKKWFRIFNKIMKGISWIFLSILIIIGLCLILIFITGKIAQQKGEYAPVSLYTIISPSMTPNIKVYDIVVVANTDAKKLKIGDVISFYSLNEFFGNTPITHRIVQKHITKDGYQFTTKGDANSAIDKDLVLESNIVGKVLFKIPEFGRIQFFLIGQGGWFIAILIPALGVIAFDAVKLGKLIIVKRKMKTIEKAENEDDINITKF